MVEVETPLAKMMAPTISGKKLVFAPILRAGVGFLDGMLNLVPSARVAHIGLYRNPETLEAVEYYFKAPADVADRLVIVMDPMLATANSAVAAIDKLKARGVKDIRFVCLLAAPEGVERLSSAHPDVADLDRGDRREAQRPRLYRARPRRRRRPHVRDEISRCGRPGAPPRASPPSLCRARWSASPTAPSAYGRIPVGAAVGAMLGAVFSFLEAVVVAHLARGWMSRLPFALYFALRLAIYFAVVIAVNLAAVAITGGGMGGSGVSGDIEFALAVCVALNLLFSVNELLGPGVLFAFAAGRYRRPRREERVLLYLDLCGSTAHRRTARRGALPRSAQRLLRRRQRRHRREGGEIHKYVGDEVIAIWARRTEPSGPIRACFAARKRLAAPRRRLSRRVSARRPAFRAAIHAGRVVIGELGAQKKEIALIGDAMNTAARILEAARETGASVLISAPYFEPCSRARCRDFGARRAAADPAARQVGAAGAGRADRGKRLVGAGLTDIRRTVRGERLCCLSRHAPTSRNPTLCGWTIARRI